MGIEWREIQGTDYTVSSDGQVGSRRRGKLRILKPHKTPNGYLLVAICTDAGMRYRTAHSLVAETFLGPRPTPKHQVNHKNGDKHDNRVQNLEWMTVSENIRHKFDVLGYTGPRGEKHGGAKLTEADIREIRARFKAGELQKHLAIAFGVGNMQISRIVRGERWSWLE